MSKFHIFCDESGIIQENYMVLGGIIFESKYYEELDNLINLCKENTLEHEIKFEKLKGDYNYKMYLNVIETLFATQKIQYRCVIFNKSQINHSKYGVNIFNLPKSS